MTVLEDFLNRFYPPLNQLVTGAARDNAVEQVAVAFFADQGSGKTNTCNWLAEQARQRYGANKVQIHYSRGADFKNSINQPWRKVPIHIFINDDLTAVPDKELEATVPQFFQIRHIMHEKTGLNEGLVVNIFVGHIFHQINKSFRATDFYLFRSVPSNEYDYRVVQSYIGEDGVKALQESENQRLIDKTRRGDTFIVHKRQQLGMVRFPKHLGSNEIESRPRKLSREEKAWNKAAEKAQRINEKTDTSARRSSNLILTVAGAVGGWGLTAWMLSMLPKIPLTGSNLLLLLAVIGGTFFLTVQSYRYFLRRPP